MAPRPRFSTGFRAPAPRCKPATDPTPSAPQMTMAAAAAVTNDDVLKQSLAQRRRRRPNLSKLHRRIDLIERALDVHASSIREQLKGLRRETFYDDSTRPDFAEAAEKAKKRRRQRGGQRVQRTKRRRAAVAKERERGVAASGDAKPDGHNTTPTNPETNPTTQRNDPNPKTNPESVVARVEWAHPRDMKLGQRRRPKTEKSREQKALAEEQKQVGWRRRIKAVEWRACKAEDEVKQLRMENEELKKAVAAGGQQEVKDSTLKGAAPEVINFCLQADVGVRDCQLRELRAQHKQLQEKTERLGQRLGQETAALDVARRQVQDAREQLAAVRAGAERIQEAGAEQEPQQEGRIAQLEEQLQEHAADLKAAEDDVDLYRDRAERNGAELKRVKAELCQVRAELQSRNPITNGSTGVSAVSERLSPYEIDLEGAAMLDVD